MEILDKNTKLQYIENEKSKQIQNNSSLESTLIKLNNTINTSKDNYQNLLQESQTTEKIYTER